MSGLVLYTERAFERSPEGAQALPQIEHADIAAFADASVNLPSEDAKHGRERVQRLRDRLERYINEHPDFSLVKMLHAGSVAKGTALRTLNDMDVAVYVRRAEAPSDAELLNWLTERLREAYDGVLDPSQITPGHHCVTVTFKSEGGLNVDVVPVLYEGDADDRGYLVAKDTGDKLLTSVRLHLEFVRARKDANADFAQIVRLVKWWVRNQQIEDPEGFKFKSFMVELVVAKLADQGRTCAPTPRPSRPSSPTSSIQGSGNASLSPTTTSLRPCRRARGHRSRSTTR